MLKCAIVTLVQTKTPKFHDHELAGLKAFKDWVKKFRQSQKLKIS